MNTALNCELRGYVQEYLLRIAATFPEVRGFVAELPISKSRIRLMG